MKLKLSKLLIKKLRVKHFSLYLTWIPPILFLMMLFLQVAVRIEVLRESYAIEKMRAQIIQSDVSLRQLRLQQASLTAPESLSKRAKVELALTSTPPQRMRTLNRERL